MANRKSGSGKGGKDADNKGLSADDDDGDLWREVTRDVKPLPAGRGAPQKRAASRKTRLTREESTQKADFGYVPDRLADHGSPPPPPGLDHRSEDRLQRGLMPIESRLDLHGLTQDQAHRRLQEFVRRNYNEGKRCVLVVTGKGTRQRDRDQKEIPWYESPPGVLRDRVPEWLRGVNIADKVLRFYPARPQHGGDGALYVLLRRKRDR